ncbi:MAG: metallophosphoesterase [Clostridiales bacterium]|nr:metallophosphoesterase [Clostridiales bacterium]
MKKVLKVIGKILLGILILILAVLIIHTACTGVAQIILRSYIKSYEPVAYDKQLVPEMGKEGFYTITSDKDIKIMQLNDLHIGGGLATLKKDKKTVYEVATMISQEKPDLVILNGDSIFAVPDVMFRGGGTLNNKMVSQEVALLFETLQCYYTVAFGNHDTEAFDYTNREKLGQMYMDEKYEYCILNSDFNGYGVTNQCILLKDTKGDITKTLFVIDSNDYIDNSIASSINWRYDVIHDEQAEWVKETLATLKPDSRSLFFFHIPIGEFETAYRELAKNDFQDTENTKYIEGVWDEQVDPNMGGRIWYGGCCQTDKDPNDVDNFFEILGPDGIDAIDACFFGHDHVNNAVVEYRGVTLGYGYSLDNTAYAGIAGYGLQRGAMVITVKPDGTWSQVHKNAYTDYGCDTDAFIHVNLDDYLYPDFAPANR